MKNKIINTELRNICIQYRTEEPLSEFEKDALKEYERLHNRLYYLQKRHTTMNGQMMKQELELDKLLEGMNLLEEKLKTGGILAGYERDENVFPDGVSVTIDVNGILMMSNEHKLQVDIYHEGLQSLENELESWNKDYDSFNEEVEVFSEKHITGIIQRWEHMVIDSVSWDDDNQEFFAVMDDLTFNKKKYFSENWNLYVEQHDNYYRTLNDLFARIQLFHDKVHECIDRAQREGFSSN